jgi:hypothetical protein
VSGIVVSGAQVEVPGVMTLSWFDDPALRLDFPNDGFTLPGRHIDAVVMHTTQGKWPQVIVEGAGKPTARATVRYWERSDEHAGAHLLVDCDGTVLCLADLQDEVAYHCVGMNKRSVGIELKQGVDGTLYSVQLDVAVRVVGMICSLLEIPRRVVAEYDGCRSDEWLDSFCGVLGHRDASRNRGRGDPGDFVMQALVDAGFESV